MSWEQVIDENLGRKAPRFVACERCGVDFVYFVPSGAEVLPPGCFESQGAHYVDNPARLRDFVRCPECGLLQRQMVTRLRERAMMMTVALHGLAMLVLFAVWDYQWVVMSSASTWELLAALLVIVSASVTIPAVWQRNYNVKPLFQPLFPMYPAVPKQEYLRFSKQWQARRDAFLAAERARLEDKEGRWIASMGQYISHVKSPA